MTQNLKACIIAVRQMYGINILLILGNVCLSQGFAVLNGNHKRDFGVVELGFWKSCRRPKINLQMCVVGEGIKLSTMPIGSTWVKFLKVHKMNYRHLGTLIWAQKNFSNYFGLTIQVSCTTIKIVKFVTMVTPIGFFQKSSKLIIRFSERLFRP